VWRVTLLSALIVDALQARGQECPRHTSTQGNALEGNSIAEAI
jgi:hypothetical protein